MGLLRWLLGLFGGGRGATRTFPSKQSGGKPAWRRARLRPLRFAPPGMAPRARPGVSGARPYRFASATVFSPGLFSSAQKGFLDFSTDVDAALLARWDLPVLATPDDIAAWLNLPIGNVAWLTGRFVEGKRPRSAREAHYVFQWKAKRGGGARLLESPKPLLRRVQTQILRDLLDRVPPHPAAHGFVRKRSILTNAAPHCGKAVVVKWDLSNFYASVRSSRVVAFFRALGYSREAALWLAALTTSAIPADLPLPESGAHALDPYRGRHLPQGAPTSPALANLSAFSLDVRLSGLARSFGGTYTRYADDITVSGNEEFARRLRNLIPLVEQVIRSERFRVHPHKRKVLRQGRRQTVAGVVVNAKPNVQRDEYDRLKAILHNTAKLGPVSQNHIGHSDFAAHLRGRIAHLSMLNPSRGEKLMRLYETIRFE